MAGVQARRRLCKRRGFWINIQGELFEEWPENALTAAKMIRQVLESPD